MNSLVLLLLGLGIFAFGWFVYSRFLARRIFRFDKAFQTPAHQFADGKDFVATNKYVLWGHHFATVAGAAPIVGPAVAMIWGWLPAFIWVTVGSIFFAGMHDMGALAAGLRHRGRSIVSIASDLISPKVTDVFMVVIFLLLLIVNAVFGLVIAKQLTSSPAAGIPSWGAIALALLVGQLIYRFKWDLRIVSILALIALYALIPLGTLFPLALPENFLGVGPVPGWMLILFLYCGIASLLPVWVLLQPRDYINGLQLFAALILIYVAVLLGRPSITAPAFVANPPASPPMVPLLFITVACGAISGFHGLVSSTVTSKQINSEPDARFVGYFGALGEGLLALATILVVAAGVGLTQDFASIYTKFGDGGSAAFVLGGANVLAHGLGVPPALGNSLLALMLILFAGTTMDSSLRLQRYLIGEWSQRFRLPFLGRPLVATLLAVVGSMLLAFGAGSGGTGGMMLWPVFGISNQLLAALNLLVIGVYLISRRRKAWAALLPMCFVLAMAFATSLIQLGEFIGKRNWLLVAITLLLQFATVLILFYAGRAVVEYRKKNREGGKHEPVEIDTVG